MATAAPTQPFTVKLEMKSEYKLGDDILCTVTVANTDSCDYQLLKDETPLEGFHSDIFHITVGDERLEYDGILPKRGPPTKDDCVEIKAGREQLVTIDLSQAHDIGKEGEHTVQLKTDFLFHNTTSSEFLELTQEIESNILKFEVIEGEQPKLTKGKQIREIEKAQAKREEPTIIKVQENTVSVDGVVQPEDIGLYLDGQYPSESQKEQTKEAYRHAYEAVKISCKVILQDKSAAQEWFGGNENKACEIYKQLKNGMEKNEYIFEADPDPKKSFYGYTHKDTTTIFLCRKYFEADLTGEDSKMGTIVHELSHAVARTDDVKLEGRSQYGKRKCRRLAKEHPEEAVRNADNYEYFAELVYEKVVHPDSGHINNCEQVTSEPAKVDSDNAESLDRKEGSSDYANDYLDPAGGSLKPAEFASNPAEVISDQAGVTSDQAGVTSDQAGVTSDQAGVTSDQAGVISDQAGVTLNPKNLISVQVEVTPDPPGCTSEPAEFTSDPAGITSEPAGITSDPAGFTSDPAGITSEPAGITSEPAGITSEPAGITSEPAGITSEPAGITSDLAGITSEPAGITSDPPKGNPEGNSNRKKLQTLMHVGRERFQSVIQTVLRPWPTLLRALSSVVHFSPNPAALMIKQGRKSNR